MKVGILLFSNMRYSPYLYSYTKLLNSIPSIEYEVIFFNRYKELGESDKNAIGISWFGKNANAANKVVKAVNFIWFKYKVQHILDKAGYDFIICLTTFPAVLISKYLVKNYACRYIVDIRDYTYEKNKSYYKREERVLSSSALNIISSPGFVNFLPKAEYTLLHNYNGLNCFSSHQFIKNDGYPIKIAYIGSVSYAYQCKKIIDMVSKDNRFELDFYGNESSDTSVSEYVNQISNPRIRFNGPFLPAEKEGIYLKSDLIFNCYGNNSDLVKYAISNKYYDGAMYRKPILVSPMTAMEEFSQGYAYPLDLDSEQSLDRLILWYRNIDCNEYEKYCQRVLIKALSDNKVAENRILKSIKYRG